MKPSSRDLKAGLPESAGGRGLAKPQAAFQKTIFRVRVQGSGFRVQGSGFRV